MNTADRTRMGDGTPGERTVMLIHGMWSGPHVWENFRAYFEASGYRVLTPTLRHHDVAPGAPVNPALATTSLAHYADDLEAGIRALGVTPFIVGHSMGGLLAQMLAARGLARGAALLASAHCAPVFALDPMVAWFFRRAFLTPFWRRTQLPSYGTMRWGALNGLDEEEARRLYTTLIPESGRCLAEMAFWYLDPRRAAHVDARKVTCPLLFLTGSEDRLTPASIAWSTADYYGGKARIEFLRGRAHWLPSEPGWEEIAARVERFFRTETPLSRTRTGAAEAAPERFLPLPA
ncbi:MAG: alpha/beta hydrolase [Parvibaculum sp.]|uniref:alpha/beta hydrolase n=1 Tax=Parvibaculum sp. TaxID=2024848 RepID=UPI003C767CB9